MIRYRKLLTDEIALAALTLLALGSFGFASPARADHLPPGIQVIHYRSMPDTSHDGHFTKEDIDLATGLAKIGDAEAQSNLGVMLASQGNYTDAAFWFRKAAVAGVDMAAYNMGTLYFNGNGFKKDYTEARKWFEMAARRQNPYAQFQLALLYFSGDGVAPDPVKEKSYYDLAARQGLAVAQYNLAVIYHNAEGVQQDDVRAYAWLLLAKSGGVDTAEAESVVTDGLSPEQIQAAKKLSATLCDAPELPVTAP